MENIDTLFVPDCEKTREIIGASVSGNEGWLPSVCVKETAIISEANLGRKSLFSGAECPNKPEYWLDVKIGANRQITESRLRDLGAQGLGIKAEWNNEEILSSAELLQADTVHEIAP